MVYNNDKRIVMTLDAGGTNFVFSAVQGNKEIVAPISLKAFPNDLRKCLNSLKMGFHKVFAQLSRPPVAISFAFPGPADYTNGIIGDLPNFPSFRGGVALGPMLQEEFKIPVFINNDGSLFALGEALAGALPEINSLLAKQGNPKRFGNIAGLTLGTGFGGGIVVNNELLVGDNGCGGDVWIFRNKKHPDYFVEESVSKRAVKRVYKQLSGDQTNLTAEEIYRIAQEQLVGDKEAAISAFQELGEMAGDAISHVATIVDGIIVIGGGLSGAHKYILPSIVKELNSHLQSFSGESYPRLQAKAYNLSQQEQLTEFLNVKGTEIPVPGTDKTVPYISQKTIGVMVSKLGASKAVSIGAYVFALQKIDGIAK